MKPAKVWLSYLSRSASRTSGLSIGSMEVNSLSTWLPSKEPATAGIHGGLTRPPRRVFQSTVRKKGAPSAPSRHVRQIRVEPSGFGSATGTGYRPLPRGNSVNKHHVIKRYWILPRAQAGGRSGPPPPLMAPQAEIYGVWAKWCMILISAPPHTHPVNLRLRSWKRPDLMHRSDLMTGKQYVNIQ